MSSSPEREREIRRVADRVRRRKAVLDRRNPLTDPDYLALFREIVALEARLRALKDPSVNDPC